MTQRAIDKHGELVSAFVGQVENLGQLGKLTNAVVEIASTGAWREYRTGFGHEVWREAEFDYFLISCGVAFEDAQRVLAWTKQGAALAPLMDREADGSRRRPLDHAARAWRTVGPETLVAPPRVPPLGARPHGWRGAGKAGDRR
jgi:hypothetical protein